MEKGAGEDDDADDENDDGVGLGRRWLDRARNNQNIYKKRDGTDPVLPSSPAQPGREGRG